jgi:hypothetical protein
MLEVSIWKMGHYYKVYSEDTRLIRQLAEAEDCKIMCEYYDRKLSLFALDAILPFIAKNGRRISRVLKKAGFGHRDRKPNLVRDEVLTLVRLQSRTKAIEA